MRSNSLPPLPALAKSVSASNAAFAADDLLPSWNAGGLKKALVDFLSVSDGGKLKFEFRGGEPVLLKLPAVDLIDDKEGKPIGTHTHIGRRPIFAFGNSHEHEGRPENIFSG